MSIKTIIETEMQHVAEAQNKKLAPLTDDLVLLNSGLDSLCFAIIVATLEDRFGVDPFTEREDVHFPVTLKDFVAFYEEALKVA